MMAEDQHGRKSQMSEQSSYLRRIRLRVFLLIVFERLWPLILPFLLLCAAFATISWFGLFPLMPRWLHLTLLSLFGFGALAALCLPIALHIPEEAEIDAYIERQNRLAHSPIQAQTDQLINPSDDPLAAALWQEHQRRMREAITNLSVGSPHPNIPSRDPLALRTIIILLFVISFAYASGNSGGHISQAFNIGPKSPSVPLRLDAWVTPPDYTGKAPIYLSRLGQQSDTQTLTVPQNSIVTIQIVGSQAAKLTSTDSSGTVRDIAAETPDNEETGDNQIIPDENSLSFQYKLTADQNLKLNGAGEDHNWDFIVTPDTPPHIEFKGTPILAANGALTLSYTLEDDYGIASAYAEIKPEAEEDHEIFPLYEAPEMALTLPRPHTKEAKTTKDLTSHPWAGSKIHMTLTAIDHAGQRGISTTKTLTLPERNFTNPLAKAIVEQRRILAMDAMQRDHILDMLSAIMLRPADTIKNAGHFLGLQTIRTRLELASTDDELRDTIAYMWEVARGIEDGNLSAAEQRLRQAQEALKQAIEAGADQDEIARLSKELQDAMQAFIREMAQRQQNNPNQNAPLSPNTKMLSEKDLQKMLEQIENLARQGSRAEAQQLLAELESILNNLQMSQAQGQGKAGQQGQQGPAGQMQQQMNKLGDIMRRQQQLMNETFNLDQKMLNQDDAFTDWPNNNSTNDSFAQPDDNSTDLPDENSNPVSPEFSEAMRELQKQQQDLKSELQKLNEELDSMGLAPAKEFSDAEGFMSDADQALKDLNGAIATDMQGEALDALRRGSREMMKKMQEALGEQEGGARAQPNQQGQEGKDPLGRRQGSSGPDFGSDIELPAEIDIQRARQVLEEIRRRLGNALSPQQEKEYLERLLKFD